MNDAQFIQENLKNIYNSNFSSLDMNVRTSEEAQRKLESNQLHVKADISGAAQAQPYMNEQEAKIIYSMQTPPAKTMYIKKGEEVYTSDVKQS